MFLIATSPRRTRKCLGSKSGKGPGPARRQSKSFQTEEESDGAPATERLVAPPSPKENQALPVGSPSGREQPIRGMTDKCWAQPDSVWHKTSFGVRIPVNACLCPKLRGHFGGHDSMLRREIPI